MSESPNDEILCVGVEGKLLAGPIDLGDGWTAILYDAAPQQEEPEPGEAAR
jgi:hypothetical protein